MPHFLIEYSRNLEEDIDMQALCETVREAALATGVFPLGGTRVRTHPCGHWSIADGGRNHAFLHMICRMGEGRSEETRKEAGEAVFAALEGFLKPVFEKRTFALSFEICEIDERFSWKANNIHKALASAAQ
jgi:5-carboxymethyl-2-hydroxymuconate isomerase